jgi:hypothetical protein
MELLPAQMFTLKPTGVYWKADAIIFADLIVILAILMTSTKKDD